MIDGLSQKRPPSLSHVELKTHQSLCLWCIVIFGEAILNHRCLKANNMHTPRPGFVQRDKEINLCPRSLQFHDRAYCVFAAVRQQTLPFEGKMTKYVKYNEVTLGRQSFLMSFGKKQNRDGERVGEWRDKKHSICKFCSLWWCWIGNVLDRQSVPLVKFFHCVSFLNQTLFQSSSTHSFSPSHCLIHILLFLFYATFLSTFFSLAHPLIRASSPFLCFILSHAILSFSFSFCVFFFFLPVH